jgi:tripartite-type tricarboxylate transporter receptor subunit TctC
MRPTLKVLTAAALIATVVPAAVSAAEAQQPYPNKPIRYIVGFTPGTATDIVARIIGQKLTERWGQQVIVDNRVGAAGTISAAMVARADPDGYTLYMAASTFVVTPFLMPVTYDIFKDFAPVILMVDLPTVLIVPPQLQINSVRELIALAKAKPGQLNYADTGPGTSSQVGAELLRSLAGIDLTQVSFKSASDALNGVVRNDIAVYYPNLAAALPLIKQGRVKALAVSSAKRTAAAPDIPPMADSVPGFDSATFYGIVVPARTPKAIIAKLHDEVAAIIELPDVRERLLGLGAEVIGGPPQVLADRMRKEHTQVGKLVKEIEAREKKR